MPQEPVCGLNRPLHFTKSAFRWQTEAKPSAFLLQYWCCIIVSFVYKEKNRADAALWSPCEQIRYHSTDTDSLWETWKQISYSEYQASDKPKINEPLQKEYVFFELQPELKGKNLERKVFCFVPPSSTLHSSIKPLLSFYQPSIAEENKDAQSLQSENMLR